MLLKLPRRGLILARILLLLSVGLLIYFFLNWSGQQTVHGKREFLHIFFAGAAVIGCGGVIVTRGYLDLEKHLWYLVGFISLILFILIITVMLSDYYLSNQYSNFSRGYNAQNNTILYSASDVDDYFKKREKKLGYKDKSVLYVSSACSIDWFEVTHSGQVRINGYFWQSFDKTNKHLMSQELEFDDALQQEIVKVFQFKNEDRDIVGWHFNARFLTDYNFVKYPLGKYTLSLGWGYKDYTDNIAFVPDFKAYNSKLTGDKIGLSPDCEILNWKIQKSNFSYYQEILNSDYGYIEHNETAAEGQLPWLLLNILIKRDYVFLLLYCFTPLAIIFFILFCITLFIGTEKLSLSTMVTYISAVLFAIVISHDLYNKSLPMLAVEQNTYFDYIFLLSYLYSILVGINGMIYYSTSIHTWPLIKYKNNIIMRLVYWPLLLFIIFLLTLFIFY